MAYCHYVQPLDPWVPNWHHEILCAVLQQFSEQLLPYVVVCMQPRGGKSEVLSRKLAGYIFGTMPHSRVMAASYAATLSESFNTDVQRIIMSEQYKEVFPHVRLNERNGVSDATTYKRNSKMFEIVGTRSYYKCAGIGGAAAGFGYTHGIVDDYLKDYKDAMSQTIRDGQWDWFRSVFLTRKAPNACVAATVTRWHHDDIIGRLKKHMKKIGNEHLLTVIEYPAIQDKDPSWFDPRERGQALWETMFPIETIQETEQMLGTRMFQALYQQNPTALEGDIIKRAWLTDNTYTPAEEPARFDMKVVSVDATFDNKGERSDFVVFQCWGVLGNQRFLLDQIRDRMNFTQTLGALNKFIERNTSNNEPPNAIWIEEAANGAAIIATMQQHMSGVSGVSVHGKSKAVRLEAAAPQFQAGQVRLPSNARWLGTFIEEFIEFPNGRNDDQVDCATLALNKLNRNAYKSADLEFTGHDKQSTWSIETTDQTDWSDYGH